MRSCSLMFFNRTSMRCSRSLANWSVSVARSPSCIDYKKPEMCDNSAKMLDEKTCVVTCRFWRLCTRYPDIQKIYITFLLTSSLIARYVEKEGKK